MALRARRVPREESSGLARCGGKEGTLKEEGVSESAPDEGALEAGVGLRIVKETFDVADGDMAARKKNKGHYVIKLLTDNTARPTFLYLSLLRTRFTTAPSSVMLNIRTLTMAAGRYTISHQHASPRSSLKDFVYSFNF